MLHAKLMDLQASATSSMAVNKLPSFSSFQKMKKWRLKNTAFQQMVFYESMRGAKSMWQWESWISTFVEHLMRLYLD